MRAVCRCRESDEARTRAGQDAHGEADGQKRDAAPLERRVAGDALDQHPDKRLPHLLRLDAGRKHERNFRALPKMSTRSDQVAAYRNEVGRRVFNVSRNQGTAQYLPRVYPRLQFDGELEEAIADGSSWRMNALLPFIARAIE